MKKIFHQSKTIGVLIIAALSLVFLLNLINIFIPSGYSTYSIWDIATHQVGLTNGAHIYSMLLIIGIFVSLIFIGLSFISVFKKNNVFIYLGIFYSIALLIAFIIAGPVTSILNSGNITLIILAMILSIGTLILQAWRSYLLKNEHQDLKEKDINIPERAKKIALGVLFYDIFLVIVSFLTLIIPFYSVNSSESGTGAHVLISIMFSNNVAVVDLVFFAIFLVLFLLSLFYFIFMISTYLYDKSRFIKQSFALTILNLIIALAFFFSSFFLCFYLSTTGISTSTVAFIPLIIVGIGWLIFSLLKGNYNALYNKQENKAIPDNKTTFRKIEPLIFVILVTAVTVLSLFLYVIKVHSAFEGYSNDVKLTGFDLLADYNSLGGGYQFMAFYIICMLMISGFALLWSLSCFISKYKYTMRVIKLSIYLNMFFVLLLGISGFYFSIAQEINKENLKSLLEFFGVSYSAEYEYTITSDMFIALIVDAVIMIVIVFRKVFERDLYLDTIESDALTINGGDSENNSSNDELKDSLDEVANFDPCPAFSELDNQRDKDALDLKNREKYLAKDNSLNSLVNFIVEYARNSRLHLSYTPEEIACFVSGLGACRLSILQGMSGTGKTSLPKIFSEAIFGNCFLVEVESSWKDKNELLGYYNEFTNSYTPKKFTQALYKASLNPEIPTFIVLDEMNLSRIEYYFSDFLSLMESEENNRQIKLVNVNLYRHKDGQLIPYLNLENGHTLHIPSNVWFIGTANRDESTFVISDKVYDRANTMNFTKRSPKVRDFKAPLPQRFYKYQMLHDMLNNAIVHGHFDAENNAIIKNVEEILRPYNISFGNRILNQFEQFVNIYEACFPSQNVEDYAIEIFLLSKVVSKLEVKTLNHKSELVKRFENLKLYQCAEFINNLDED